MYEYRKMTPDERAEVVRQRVACGYPPHSPPHPVQGQLYYLLTAACLDHQPFMQSSSRRRQLLDQLFEAFIQAGIEVDGWVILPNHYHFLVWIGDFSVIGSIIRLVHGRTAHDWNKEDHQSGRKVWYRYSDRAIRSERHYFASLNYLHYNPVKHGWATRPTNGRRAA